MCGIVAYIGEEKAQPILLDALRRLDYRGYDSAGVALLAQKKITVHKTQGSIDRLEQITDKKNGSKIGIAHTRWATHGAPTTENAHPHTDCKGSIAVVHNGIIENYLELRERLESEGHEFTSETDTEVLPHLIESYYNGDLRGAVASAIQEVEGSFAIAVLCTDTPDAVIAARRDMPLIIGLGQGEKFIASDIPAILKHTRSMLTPRDDELIAVRKDTVSVTTLSGEPITLEPQTIEWDAEAAEKGGYPHFMLKEIHEQPFSIRETLAGRTAEIEATVKLEELGLTKKQLRKTSRIIITACGTSYYAGMLGRYLLEKHARIPACVQIASELRYGDMALDKNMIVIGISQSGETADTIAAIREAKKHGCTTIAIANIMGSTLTREADTTLYIRSGPEIGVAATKTFTSQLILMHLLSIYLGRLNKTMEPAQAKNLIAELKSLPGKAQELLDDTTIIEECARLYASSESYFFIGRNLNYPVALEGALKLKEISYIHAEGYPAGELKHGPLALLSEGVPVVAIATKGHTYPKTLSNIKEMKARGASIIAIANQDDTEIYKYADHVIPIPTTTPQLSPILSAIAVQLLAYYTASERNCPIDKPRNLAKSVTVE